MKRLLLAALAALTLLAFTACDRFPHIFDPPQDEDLDALLFQPLNQALQNQPEAGIDELMQYFADDYMHSGISKAERRDWLEGIFRDHPNAFASANLIEIQKLSDLLYVSSWRLYISEAETVIADSSFVGDEAIKRDGRWMLRGNQASCVVPNPKQRVIIEYFTFPNCPNCPPVEAELQHLQLDYPNNLSFLEYHITGPLQIPGEGTHSYYGVTSAPTTIFQGETKLSGSAPETLAEFAPLVASLAEVECLAEYSNLSYWVQGQTVTGSIKLNLSPQVPNWSDLVLNVVLIERQASHPIQQHPMHNLVRAKNMINIGGTDLSQPVNFVLNASENIPDDAFLVIFAQHRPASFANNARIYGGIEVPISR
ncbi:MAG: hypothetical protein WCY21_04070 [Candidatus Cloacimonadaceae bacterium]|jgi:hypothetical protein|nr:thioredoxin family protein [Candidatus Cloacimonadota bacterium]MDX9949508.1 hypothetical protein [Candidatus Syntrophosphaera sp.]NLN85574.1 thioredoxin family protein [Candidatus Cloacimonadota bacterium]